MRYLLLLLLLLLCGCKHGSIEFIFQNESDPLPFSVPLKEQLVDVKSKQQQLKEKWEQAMKGLMHNVNDSLILTLSRENDPFILSANVEIEGADPTYLGVSDECIVGEVTLYRQTSIRVSREVCSYILIPLNPKKDTKIITTIRGWIEE